MNLFDSVLEIAKGGELVSSYCGKCEKYVWPPKYYCNYCNSKVLFKIVKREGRILGKGYSNIPGKKGIFAVGEFNGIRIIGTIKDKMMVGESIIMQEIKVTNGRLDIIFVSSST